MIHCKKCLLVLCALCGMLFSFAQKNSGDEQSVAGSFNALYPVPERPLAPQTARPVLFDPVSVSFSIYLSTRPRKPYAMQMSSTLGVMMQALRSSTATPVVHLRNWNEKSVLPERRNELVSSAKTEVLFRNASFNEVLVLGW